MSAHWFFLFPTRRLLTLQDFESMPHTLQFDVAYSYFSGPDGIWIPTFLTVGATTVECEAKVDTGAEFCLFQRELADQLGLQVEAGQALPLQTLNSCFKAYGHEVKLGTLGLAFQVTVYFAEDYGLPRNLLGRNGWLQQVKLSVIDYEETLYLSAYEPIIN
jgi:hypothetical protein